MSKITLNTPTVIQVISYSPSHPGGMKTGAAQIISGAEYLLKRQMKS